MLPGLGFSSPKPSVLQLVLEVPEFHSPSLWSYFRRFSTGEIEGIAFNVLLYAALWGA